jgi:putative lipoprotein
VALGLALTLAQPASAQSDPWWGRDKSLHLGLSTGLALSTAWILGRLDVPPPLHLGAAAGLTLLLGASKELADSLGLGTPSWRDFAWDVVGCVCGLLLAVALEALARWIEPTPRLLLAPER